jgi:hypothetical protein
MACGLCDDVAAGDRRKAVPATGDRRDPGRQQPIAGGARATDPPLTTRECADYMNMTPVWVRRAIDEGVLTRGRLVKLEAETITVNGRRLHRIHLDRFIAFLQAIGWQRIPTWPRDRAEPSTARAHDVNRSNRSN